MYIVLVQYISHKEVSFVKGAGGKRCLGWVFSQTKWTAVHLSLVVGNPGACFLPSSPRLVKKGFRETKQIACPATPGCLVLTQTLFLRGSAQSRDLPKTCLLGSPLPSSQPHFIPGISGRFVGTTLICAWPRSDVEFFSVPLGLAAVLWVGCLTA